MPGYEGDGAVPDSTPLHAGVVAYRQGLPLPEPPMEDDADAKSNGGGQ
jgi:hypothetical protein